jgi:hypothetical protein
MSEKKKIIFFALYFLLAPISAYKVGEHFWETKIEAEKYSSYVDGIERGKWVYVIDVHQPKVWADGEHDDAVALQKIIERSAGLNPTGVRPSITWFSEPRTHLIKDTIVLQPPTTIVGVHLIGSGVGMMDNYVPLFK